MMDLDIGICSDMEKRQKKKLLIDYLWDNLRYHNWWAYRYFFCELLALINVIGGCKRIREEERESKNGQDRLIAGIV